MRNLLIPSLLGISLVAVTFGCNKDNNSYELADYTLGMLSSRTWHKHVHGYYKGDTVILGNKQDWPKPFSRTLDTTFSIVKINAFVIEAAGTRLAFESIDSALTTRIFDSTYANSARSYLLQHWGKDSFYYEHHQVGEYNPDAGKAYETHETMWSTN